MDIRKKAAIILLAVILYETACDKFMPQSFRGSPFERYINKQRYSPNIPTTCENGRKTHRFQDDLTKQSKLYSKISPIDVSDSFINNLKREKRMKRKLQRAQKIYTRDNDETFTIPESFHNQGPPFCLSEAGLFPEVQYPLTAFDTWIPNYWNSLPSNNHDRYLKKDTYITGCKKPNIDCDVFKKTKYVHSLELKDENDVKKYRKETQNLTEKKNVSTGTNEKIRKSKKKQVSDTKNELNQNISNDKSNETQSTENIQNIKTENIMTKEIKTNASIEKINKVVSQETMSNVNKQKSTGKDEIPETLKKIEKTFSPKTKERTHVKSVSKKFMSTIDEVTSHFSKLISKLEQLSNEHKITSTTSTNQIISFSPTNGTSNSANQEQETKVPAHNNLTNILQVEIISKENMEAPGVEIPNLVQPISDKTIKNENEGAQTTFKINDKEESDLPFSFTDYLVRNQLLDVLSDPKLNISSLRNGIFKILEEIDSKSVEESNETLLSGINESAMLPLIDKNLKEDNLKSLLPDHGVSCIDKQESSLENFNEAILLCTNASFSSSETISKNKIFDDKSEDTEHRDNVCEDDPPILDHFVTENLAKSLRKVISEPSSSNTLIEDLSEIIRLLTVWNSNTDDSSENVHQTTEIGTFYGYIPITTELSCEGCPKAATDHSYEVISDSDVINHSIKDETHELNALEYSRDDSNENINLLKVTAISSEGVNDNWYEKNCKLNVTDQTNEDKTEYSCENIHKHNVTVYSSEDTNDTSSDHFKFNETKYSNENIAGTREDITEPNVNDYLNDYYSNEDHAKNLCKDIHQPNATVYSCEDVTDCSNEDISSNVTYFSNEDVTNFSCVDIHKSNVTEYYNEDETESSSKDTCMPKSMVNLYEGVIDYLDEVIDEQNVTDHSNKTLAETFEDIGSFAIPIDDDDRTSHRGFSDTTPLSVLPTSFTYEVNEEIPDTELVTFEKFNNITSTETITDKEIISNDNFTADILPVFTFDDVFESLSDNSETPLAFVSTYLPSYDENILKLHNETETEMFKNLPTIPNRDKKAYDEVCPVTGNESSENQHLMVGGLANLNNSRCFTRDKEDLLNLFTNNITELFGDKENPDFYDFILYPEEYENTEASENNDTRELNSDTTLDFTDYTVLPDDTTFTENNEENYIETLATTVNPFDQYDEDPEQNAESNVSVGSSKSNEIIHNFGNTDVTQDTMFDYTLLSEDPTSTKYFDDNLEEEHQFQRPLYERNVKPLLHRDFVKHHQK